MVHAIRWVRRLPNRWGRNSAIAGVLAVFLPAYQALLAIDDALLLLRALGFWSAIVLLSGAGGFAMGWLARRSLGRDLSDAAKLRRRVTRNWLLGIVALGVLLSLAQWQFGARDARSLVDPAYRAGQVIAPLLLLLLVGVPILVTSRLGLRRAVAPSAAEPISVPVPLPVHGGSRWNVVARHWRGELPLWVAYWVIGLASTFAVLVFARVLGLVLGTEVEYEPTRLFAQLGAIWAFVLAVSLWQLVGVWRAARRHESQGGSRFWAGLAKFAIVLGAARGAIELALTAVPQAHESVRMAFLGDPGIPPYSLRLLRGETEIELAGGIKYGLSDDLRRMLDAAPRAKVIHLNSIGGRIGEAERLGRLIADRRLAVYTSSECSSACTIAYVAARERWLHPEAQLGFHAGAFPGLKQAALIASMQRKPLTKAGVRPDFIDRALATPNDDMWYPTRPELMNAGVVTALTQPGQFGLSGWGVDVDSETVSLFVLYRGAVYEALEAASPDDFARVVAIWQDGYRRGDTETDIERTARAVLSAAIIRHRPLADDATLIDWAKLAIDQAQHLTRIGSAVCAEYFAPTPGARDFSRLLPPALVDREGELATRVLESAAPRPALDASVLQTSRAIVLARLRLRFGDLAELPNGSPGKATHADYCRISIGMFQEILALDQPAAQAVLRQVFAAAAP